MSFMDLFTKYSGQDFRQYQENHYSGFQKLMNKILEFSLFKKWRENRGKVFAKDLLPWLLFIRDNGNLDNIVDFGCGQGDIIRSLVDCLKRENPQIKAIGIDNATSIADYKIDDNLAFWLGDALHTEFGYGFIDVALALYFLQHQDEEGKDGLFKELKKTVDPDDGRIIFAEVIKQGWLKNGINKIKHYVLNPFKPYDVRSVQGWIDLLEKKGFEVLDTAEMGGRSMAFLTKIKPVKH